MTLVQLLEQYHLDSKSNAFGTDKNYPHKYLEYFYDPLFKLIENPKIIAEVGVWRGASCVLWKLFFPNCSVHGYDIKLGQLHPLAESMRERGDLDLYQCDGYSDDFFQNLPEEIDILIDDGPHSLHTQLKFIQYRTRLSSVGCLIIEDIQFPGSDSKKILESLPTREQRKCLILNFSRKSGRYDDEIFLYSNSEQILEFFRKSEFNVEIAQKNFVTFYFRQIRPRLKKLKNVIPLI